MKLRDIDTGILYEAVKINKTMLGYEYRLIEVEVETPTEEDMQKVWLEAYEGDWIMECDATECDIY